MASGIRSCYSRQISPYAPNLYPCSTGSPPPPPPCCSPPSSPGCCGPPPCVSESPTAGGATCRFPGNGRRAGHPPGRGRRRPRRSAAAGRRGRPGARGGRLCRAARACRRPAAAAVVGRTGRHGGRRGLRRAVRGDRRRRRSGRRGVDRGRDHRLPGLDHADGLAGTVGAVGAFGVAACATAELMEGLAALLGVLAAALIGFLLHNWFPAQAGLGAAGALFTGFLLAASAVFVRAGQGTGAGAAVLYALTAVACADAVLVVLGRRLDRRGVTRGRPDHLGHRLRRLGLVPRAVPVLLGAASAAGRWSRCACTPAGCPRGGVVGRGGRRGARADAGEASRHPCFPSASTCRQRVAAGQRAVACKKRIRVESARLSSVDPMAAVMHA